MMIKTLKKICVVLGFLATSLSMAQTNTIKMLVAFPPGGPVDFVARTIAEPLGKELGAQILIDNKPGGNGAINLIGRLGYVCADDVCIPMKIDIQSKTRKRALDLDNRTILSPIFLLFLFMFLNGSYSNWCLC